MKRTILTLSSTKLKKGAITVLLLPVLVMNFNCSKRNNQSSTDHSKPQESLNFSPGIPAGVSAPFIESSENPLSDNLRKMPDASTNLKVSSCGYGFGRSYSSSGSYTYPNDTLELSFTAPGTTVSLYLQAYNVPNRFTIYDGTTGAIVAASPWMGYASYAGPWGMSINTSATGTLTFSKGSSAIYYLKVETSVKGTTDTYSAMIGCPNPTPEVALLGFQNASVTNTMISSFNALTVNLSQLSTQLGLSHTLSAGDFDFTNLTKSYINNDYDSSYAVVAGYIGNSSCAYGLATDGVNYGQPMIVKTTPTTLQFYDLTSGLVTTINNYKSSNFTTTVIPGGFGGTPGGCGKKVIDCFIDAYSNHGWTSVFASLISTVLPETAFAITAACAVNNCNKFSK